MPLYNKKLRVYKKIFSKIHSAKKIALISHKNPDLDTLWSACWFYEILQTNFPQKSVQLFCVDAIPQKYFFLPHTYLYQSHFTPNDFDLIIFFDSGGKDQTWYDQIFPTLYDGVSYNTINIDHHITNQMYGKQNVLNTTYGATTMIVFEMFFLLQLSISPVAATCFLTGIYSDTGGLKHGNTDMVAYFMAAKLLELWAQREVIVQNIFFKNKLSTLRLWGKILKESFIDSHDVLFSYIHKSGIDSYQASYEDVSWVIDYLNMVEGIRYSTLLTQKWDYIKGSLRTLRDDVDLTQIAKKYNGGGHKKASWFTISWLLAPTTTLSLIQNNGTN